MRLVNPLDAFQSYSIHHIMLACRTTDAAKAFADTNQQSATLQAISSAKSLGDQIVYGTGSDAYLVMDTRRFSQYTIKSLKYEVLINGLQSGGGAPPNLATMINMTIIDSVGISFINFLQWLMDSKMQTNFDGMVFMLRTIFVGHTPEGTSETVQTVTIPMHLFKLEVNLDYAKGIYNCEFMPNFNFDTNNHRRWLNINSVTSYFTGASNRLVPLVQNFQDRLNKQSLEIYTRTSKLITEAKKLPTQADARYGRPVQYMITLPERWNEFEYQGNAVADLKEEIDFRAKQQADTAAKAGSKEEQKSPASSSTTTVEPDITIIEVLEKIFSQVPGIKQLGAGDALKGSDRVITFYKYLVSITSNNEGFTVHVDVIEFRVPDATPSDKSKDVSSRQDELYTIDEQGRRVPKLSFEYDYIFSGRNLDILNFDMKIQDLQFLLASNVAVSEGQMFGVSDRGQQQIRTSTGKVIDKTQLLSLRRFDPIMLPHMTDEELQAFSQYANPNNTARDQQIIADTQQYTRNLSQFYAASPITVNMTIKGNPDMMGFFNVNTLLDHTSTVSATAEGVSAVDAGPQRQHRINVEQMIIQGNNGLIRREPSGAFTVQRASGPSYVSQPVFMKVNIFGPNVDAGTNELIAGQNFATRVLYDNYYVVFKVINNIEDGVFTQDMEMWSHNIFGFGKIDTKSDQVQRV